jgi:PKD repeat protein
MIGVLMLVAIFVVAAGIIAVMYFSTPPSEKPPAVNVVVTNETRHINLYHAGGDALARNDLIFYVDGTPVQFAGFDADGTWSAGRTLDYTLGATDPMPSKIDVVYTGAQWRGTTGYLLASVLLGNLTSADQEHVYCRITASATSGGTINPSGTFTVPAGTPLSFAIANSSGYLLTDVQDNGISLGPVTSYYLSGTSSDHIITAIFVPGGASTFWIDATAGNGGTISPAGTIPVLFGGNKTFAITPYTGYLVGSVVVNGTPLIPVSSNYTFSNVTANQSIAATFASNYSKGVIGNYYIGYVNWTAPVYTNVASRIYFADTDSGYASDATDWPSDYIGRTDYFSVNFTGLLKIEAEDDYTFYLTSDDDSYLNLNGARIINNGGSHSPAMVSGTVHLKPGYYPLALPMSEQAGGAVCWLQYSNTTISRTADVPLYHSPVTIPTVDFTGAPVSGTAPHTVQFADKSVDATTWMWDFGDGSAASYLQNPSHTYTSIGLYNVTLTAANVYGAGTRTRPGYISVGGSYTPGWIGTYFANETWTDPGRSRTDYRILFADSASGEVSDETNWPDGLLGQTESFSVNWDGYLRVNRSDTYTFTLRSDDGSWLWIDEAQVIDNGGLHSATNVSGAIALDPGYHHIVVRMYEHTGSAVARLIYVSPNVTRQYVSDVWHVNVVYPPVAGFTGAPVGGNAPLAVAFTDTSTNTPTAWSWTFGDGNTTGATSQNPVHLYTATGLYNVSLTATNEGGSGSYSRTEYVNVSPALSVASFTGTPVSGGIPLNVTFTDGSTNAPTAWSWDFGDGASSNVQNLTHAYTVPGIYDVTLTVTNAGGTNASTRAGYIYANPTIIASSGTGGTISPSGSTVVTYGTNQSFTIAPYAGYAVSAVTVDGVSQGSITSYTFANATAAHTISVLFAIKSYTITASAGTGGTIAPSGSVSVNYGSNQTFSITNTTGYYISSVLVDGSTYGSPSVTAVSYTFTNITAAHTIVATFAANPVIASSAGTGGAISPSGSTSVTYGSNQSFTITPNAGYAVLAVTADGVSQGAIAGYTFSDVTASHSISATFVAISHTITASSGTGGTISPSGTTTVAYGGSQAYTITPASGYYISSILIDGSAYGSPSASAVIYTFSSVTADHTIAVTFAANPAITSSRTNTYGTITPLGSTSVTYGGSQAYTITPNSGYYISSIMIDGSAYGSPSASAVIYTFSGVTATHTIAVTFAANPVITSSRTNTYGTITPLGSTSVTYGGSQAYTITPNSGYYISSILIDGSAYGSPSASAVIYTFSGVTATHTIAVTFAANPVITSTRSSSRGTITPLGSTSVTYGGSQAYTITPNSGYHANVTVDGTYTGAPTSYTFSNVVAAHTIAATFTANPTITSLSRTTGTRGSTYTGMYITGTNFITSPYPSVVFTYGSATMTPVVTAVTATRITFTLTIPGSQTTGPYSVTVTNADSVSVTKTTAFTVS